MLTAVVTIIIFLVMISLHEFGHFIAAKSVGITVLEFSVGMGPALWKRQKGETLYSIRALPVGGYCKFEGEDTESDSPNAFNKQPVWKRMITVAAGAIFNVLLGFVLFVIIMSQASGFYTNTIDSVSENTYFAESGAEAGDKIVKIDGKRISFYRDITLYTSNLTGDEVFDVTVKRDGEKYTYTIRPSERYTKAEYTEEGILYTQLINGVGETRLIEYGESAARQEDKIGTYDEATDYIIGFSPSIQEKTVGTVISQSYYMTKYVVKLIYQSLWDMITGKTGVDQLSGPVGIVSEVNNGVKRTDGRWEYLMNLTGLLTINLGVFNMLPIPALDGGRFVFLIVEAIRRKPVPPEKEGMVHAIGLLLLFALIIAISFKDIYQLITGGI